MNVTLLPLRGTLHFLEGPTTSLFSSASARLPGSRANIPIGRQIRDYLKLRFKNVAWGFLAVQLALLSVFPLELE